MESQMELLRGLMKLDREYFELRARLSSIPAELEELERREAELTQMLLSEQARLSECQRDRRQMEARIQDQQTSKRRYEDQIYSVREPRQLQSLQREIDHLRETLSGLEDEVIKNLQQEEELELRVKHLREETDRQRAGIEERDRHLRRQREEISASLEEMEVRRRRLLDGLRPGIRSKYQRIVDAKGQEAIVAVTDGSCGGCYYRLPPQMVAEVRLGNRLILCEGCGRILVWANDSGS